MRQSRRKYYEPTEGFVTIIDGHFKSEFDTVDAAEASARKLKAAYPMLQIEIYDAANKVRALLSQGAGSSAHSQMPLDASSSDAEGA
jgi:hypothetical protein